MRIAVGQLSQETNTFNPWPTTRQDFEDFGIFRGAEPLRNVPRSVSEIGHTILSIVPEPGEKEAGTHRLRLRKER